MEDVMAIALVDSRISRDMERSLLREGFRVIPLPPSSRLSWPIASHPDMLMLYDSGNIITSTDYCDEAPFVFTDIREFSTNVSMNFTSDVYGKNYPEDAIFNALIMGEFMFCKTDSISSAVLDYARGRSLTVNHVNQGYPACTTLAISDKAAITADVGMARALSECGIRVSLIENGAISLEPYEYGFIGGACGVYNGRAYFLGDVTRHPSYNEILRACEAESVVPVSLSSEKLTDLGRIIFID